MTVTREQQPLTFHTQAFIDGNSCDAVSGSSSSA